MNYLVIDLEMCKVPKHYRSKKYKYATEIIQVGAVLLDETYEVLGSLNQYVHPEHGVIDYYISNLTGIRDCQVKHAPLLKEVLKSLTEWLGNREYQVFAWSDNDYNQLLHEILSKEIQDPEVESFMASERWTDYQKQFVNRFDFSRAVALGEALMYCDIDVDGRLHDGLADAMNTAKLIRALETNENFALCNRDMDWKAEAERLSYSMGNLLTELNLSWTA